MRQTILFVLKWTYGTMRMSKSLACSIFIQKMDSRTSKSRYFISVITASFVEILLSPKLTCSYVIEIITKNCSSFSRFEPFRLLPFVILSPTLHQPFLEYRPTSKSLTKNKPQLHFHYNTSNISYFCRVPTTLPPTF
jgi:hypothetical protein